MKVTQTTVRQAGDIVHPHLSGLQTGLSDPGIVVQAPGFYLLSHPKIPGSGSAAPLALNRTQSLTVQTIGFAHIPWQDVAVSVTLLASDQSQGRREPSPSATAQHPSTQAVDISDRAPFDGTEIAQATYSFAKQLAAIPAVKAISVATDGDILRVWTFIERRDKAVRQQIYEHELTLMDQHLSLKFDFNVVSLDSLGEGEFLPADSRGQLVYYRSDFGG